MFNIRYLITICEYECNVVSRDEREGFGLLCSYENGKKERLNSPD